MALLFALVFLLQTPAGSSCSDVAECRAQAEAAAARHDYETFHDLAWRAVQKGRRNDTDLMYLLARAQSLSGRLDDALVMIERLADIGVRPDVADNPDFALVRQLARWPQVAAKLGVPAGPAGPAAGTPEAPASPVPPSATSTPAAAAPVAPASAADTATAAERSAPAAGGALEFDAPSITPVALAHDAVSKRFLVGDRASARLLIIDEMSHHVVNYASGATAGFYDDLTGFAIDARRGDLWVASTKGHEAAAVSVLHKLQLVSGRTLMDVHLPEGSAGARLVDVTVTPDGTVYAIDEVGSRLFRVRAGARRLEEVMPLGAASPTAITAVDDRVLYVAADGGLLRVDVTSDKATRVKSVEQLTRFVSLSWRGNAVVGVERVADSFLIVRVALDPSGTRAEPRAVLAASSQPTVGTLTAAGFYYLAAPGTIRLVKVR
ncbi:MAG TPA: hypothetical protein VFZ98_09525 [Vicinamibacterales bacterium]